MANKGGSGYIKRLNAPKYFSVHRKEHAYVIKQNPGRHTLQKSIALTLVLDKLELAANRSESAKIIKSSLVSVNGKVVKDPKFPVGLNDIVQIGPDKYMLSVNERGQILIEKGRIGQVYKVVGKYKYKDNSTMVRLHDGSIRKSTNDVKVNDSVSVSENKISKVIKLDKGSKCQIIDGVHVGKAGKITDIREGNIHKQKSVVVEQMNGESFETLVKNIIIVE